MLHPVVRPRRLRKNGAIRRLVRETKLDLDDIIAPLFVVEGRNIRRPISSLEGQYHLSADTVCQEAAELYELGIPAVLLFGLPGKKDEIGSSSCDPQGVVQRAILNIKDRSPDLLVVADLCFCEYTDHGHCGVLIEGEVDNDLTLVETQKQALALARAGADVIAPSGMMDGMVGAIRTALDEAGFTDKLILSYSAKYASAYYGPFRTAAASAPSFGDRKGYQMDPGNSDEALKEIALDIEQGADIVMVKPALAYLDVIYRAKETFSLPLCAYNVSGEYAMIKAAAKQGLIDEERVMLETLLSIKRAGADMIITYFAKDLARIFRGSV